MPTVVETLEATDLRSRQGRIRGRVDADGGTVTAYLVWGLSPDALDFETDPVEIASDEFFAFAELLVDLTPNTTYYYQAIAEGGGAPELLAEVSASPGQNGGTTAAIDTTGATLIVISVSYFAGNPITWSDNQGNTYTPLPDHGGSGGNFATHRFLYTLNPTTNASHTFTASGSTTYPAFTVYAFSGIGSYDSPQQSGASQFSGLTIQPGTVTPSADGALILTGLGGDGASTDSVAPAEFTQTTRPYGAGNNMRGATAWLIQETAAGINPTWTMSVSAQSAASAAVFLPGGGGGGSGEGEILSFTTPGEQTFTDGLVSHPLTWITLTQRDETRHPYAEVDLNDPPDYYDGYKAPYVERFLTIARGLSDRDGQIEHLTFGAIFTDTHRQFRALLEDETNKYLTNRPLEEWFIDDEDRRLLGLARLAAVGFVNDYGFPPNLQFELRGADWLKKKFSRKRKAQQSWQPLIPVEDFPDCPELTLNTPAPIIYGSLGLGGADPVLGVTVTINAQPTAEPGGFSITTVAGGITAGVTRYYKVSQVVGGLESDQSDTLSATTTNTNRTIRTSWTPDGSATKIYLYRSHRADFLQFAVVELPGNATTYDDDSSLRADFTHVGTDGDWNVSFRLNLSYYVYANLGNGLFSLPGVGATIITPRPRDPDRYGDYERDLTISWTPHAGAVDGYRVIRLESLYSNWAPTFDRQWDVGSGDSPGESVDDDLVTMTAVDVPAGELIAVSAAGQAEAIYVGDLSVGSPAQNLKALLVARHACARVGAIYVPQTLENVEGETATTYAAVADAEYGVTWFAPDRTGWLYPEKYVDINGRRYTLIFTSVEPLPDKVLVDVDGIEENGDGEGTLITSIVLQRLHFMNNWIAPETPYESGAYLTAADTLFPHIPGLPLVDEDSHYAVVAALEDRLEGGYVGATIIGAGGEFVTATDALARFHMSGDFDQAFNRKGQDTVSCEPVAPSSDLVAITDIISIRADSFAIQDQVQTAFFNILPYVHSRDYTGRERTGWYGNEETRSQTSIDNYDQERESPRFELHCCRANSAQGAATIADVMARKLARYQDPRRVGTLVLPFSGLEREPGSTAAISHVEGIGASGWELKEVRFTRHEVDPTDGTVRLDFYDLTKVFENQGSG